MRALSGMMGGFYGLTVLLSSFSGLYWALDIDRGLQTPSTTPPAASCSLSPSQSPSSVSGALGTFLFCLARRVLNCSRRRSFAQARTGLITKVPARTEWQRLGARIRRFCCPLRASNLPPLPHGSLLICECD